MSDSLILRHLDFPLDAARVFPLITGTARYAFWIDSARTESPMSRFSYVGVVPENVAVLRVEEAGERSPWVLLEDALVRAPRVASADIANFPELQDELLGGYVGYFGYEARRSLGFATPYSSPTPDALWMPAVRYAMIDHLGKRNFLVGDSEWVATMEATLRRESAGDGAGAGGNGNISESATPDNDVRRAPKEADETALTFPAPNRERYLADIAQCLHEIYEGNSYEVCLTAETRTALPPQINNQQGIFDLYCAQRRHNSAPYAAFLRCDDHYILSSSPERFLSITADGVAETKPIKGTIARSQDPVEDVRRAEWLAADPKTRAENLMIVDLLRNDLSRVSVPGSVRVPVLMGVESYSTVHQLVSTITSQLREGVSAVGAASSCFPGGSMTGAPKPSTMEIIDRLEQRARGVYSGALGFFSASGAANLSVVIRTLVVLPNGEVSLSAGGAIVADSHPDDEYREMLDKLAAATPPTLR